MVRVSECSGPARLVFSTYRYYLEKRRMWEMIGNDAGSCPCTGTGSDRACLSDFSRDGYLVPLSERRGVTDR